MPDPISGLLRQKPTSPVPEIGNTLCLSVTKTEKRNKPGEFWNKLKNEGEGYGESYKVLKVDQLPDPDQHGNITFSLLIEPVSEEGAGAVGEAASSKTSGSALATSDRSAEINRAVAFKEASRQVAAGKMGGSGDTAKDIAVATETLLPIVTGSAEGKAEPPLDTAESVQADQKTDDDIPF